MAPSRRKINRKLYKKRVLLAGRSFTESVMLNERRGVFFKEIFERLYFFSCLSESFSCQESVWFSSFGQDDEFVLASFPRAYN